MKRLLSVLTLVGLLGTLAFGMTKASGMMLDNTWGSGTITVSDGTTGGDLEHLSNLVMSTTEESQYDAALTPEFVYTKFDQQLEHMNIVAMGSNYYYIYLKNDKANIFNWPTPLEIRTYIESNSEYTNKVHIRIEETQELWGTPTVVYDGMLSEASNSPISDLTIGFTDAGPNVIELKVTVLLMDDTVPVGTEIPYRIGFVNDTVR